MLGFTSNIVRLLSAGVVVVAAAAAGASAQFQMQIRAVVGGINGDLTAQVIELRMRAAGQNGLSGAKLVSYDAAGANAVVLFTFPANSAAILTNAAVGDHVLLVTPGYASCPDRNPLLVADFVMTAPIPAARVNTGMIAFESAAGTRYWVVASENAGTYTGTTACNTLNDGTGAWRRRRGGCRRSSGCWRSGGRRRR